MLDQIPGTVQVTKACLAARGGTITKALDAIAWTDTAHQPGPWSDGFYRNTRDSVRDYAAHIYDMLDGYHPDVEFDDLRPEHHDECIRSVAASFDEPGDERLCPIKLADHLLDGLRKAAALRVEAGEHLSRTYSDLKVALVSLLRTQSVGVKLAQEAIDHALTTGTGTGTGIHQAVEEMDGQL
ncbi:hypothetical protein [Nonomuraea lactucae]|uniref:hypothetical protein n=1 Tax=Nonomuraea lactucae TaxID=2249762 RepID=UPI000DE3D5B2|nr:hypothetical protein [Nonomuraea lactucae]